MGVKKSQANQLPSEDWEQIQVIKWCRQWPKWEKIRKDPAPKGAHKIFHIPNGGKRTPREAMKFKQMGVKRGVSDLFLPVAVGDHAGLWIEMKDMKPSSKPTDEQNDFMIDMLGSGFCATWAKGHQAAIDVIIEYFAT